MEEQQKEWQVVCCCVLLSGKGSTDLPVANFCGHWPPLWSASVLCNLTSREVLSSTLWYQVWIKLSVSKIQIPDHWMSLWLLWIHRMSVWSFPLYGVSMSFTASRRQSCHLSRNASAAGFPSGQSEFLRPGSLLWPHPPWRPYFYSNSIITSHICRQLFYSCCYLAYIIFFLINLSWYICLQQCPNAGTNFLSSI